MADAGPRREAPSSPDEAGEVTDHTLRRAFLGGRCVALLVGQRLIGSKSFGE